jgi:hypothetical protein
LILLPTTAQGAVKFDQGKKRVLFGLHQTLFRFQYGSQGSKHFEVKRDTHFKQQTPLALVTTF